MKSLTISAGCLLLATFVSGECVTVEPVKPVAFQASSERVRIHTLLNGKGLKDVRLVFFYSTEQQPRLALSTDQQGLATTPSLSPGHYRILATAPENQFSELYLDVSEKRQRVSSFLIDLTAKPLTPAVLAARTAAVENAPVT